MDITSVFGTVVLGSSPGGCTNNIIKLLQGRFGYSRYGLVVEYVLAKDETRVRFPLSAQKRYKKTFCVDTIKDMDRWWIKRLLRKTLLYKVFLLYLAQMCGVLCPKLWITLGICV